MDCLRKYCARKSAFKGVDICNVDGVPTTDYINIGECALDMNSNKRKKIKMQFYDDERRYNYIFRRHYDEDGKYRG